MSDNMKTVITVIALVFMLVFMFFPKTVRPEPVKNTAVKEYSKRFEEYTLEQLVKQIVNGENGRIK